VQASVRLSSGNPSQRKEATFQVTLGGWTDICGLIPHKTTNKLIWYKR
jgi:hypothetical protein